MLFWIIFACFRRYDYPWSSITKSLAKLSTLSKKRVSDSSCDFWAQLRVSDFDSTSAFHLQTHGGFPQCKQHELRDDS